MPRQDSRPFPVLLHGRQPRCVTPSAMLCAAPGAGSPGRAHPELGSTGVPPVRSTRPFYSRSPSRAEREEPRTGGAGSGRHRGCLPNPRCLCCAAYAGSMTNEYPPRRTETRARAAAGRGQAPRERGVRRGPPRRGSRRKGGAGLRDIQQGRRKTANGSEGGEGGPHGGSCGPRRGRAVPGPSPPRAVQTLRGGSGRTAGPWRTSPSTPNREPWHGHSHAVSASLNATRQPRCVQRADSACRSPPSSR